MVKHDVEGLIKIRAHVWSGPKYGKSHEFFNGSRAFQRTGCLLRWAFHFLKHPPNSWGELPWVRYRAHTLKKWDWVVMVLFCLSFTSLLSSRTTSSHSYVVRCTCKNPISCTPVEISMVGFTLHFNVMLECPNLLFNLCILIVCKYWIMCVLP